MRIFSAGELGVVLGAIVDLILKTAQNELAAATIRSGAREPYLGLAPPRNCPSVPPSCWYFADNICRLTSCGGHFASLAAETDILVTNFYLQRFFLPLTVLLHPSGRSYAHRSEL